MSTLRWQVLDLTGESVHAKLGEEWNELWERSAVTHATARWEPIINWQRIFAPESRLLAITVHEGEQLRAALPLIAGRARRIIPVWRSLCSDWGMAGDLLVDSLSSHPESVFDHLVDGIRSLRRPWLWFDVVDLARPRWQGLIAALERHKLAHVARERFPVGKVVIHGPHAPHDWAAYQAAWSGNFRRQMRKMVRRAEELGGVHLEIHRPHNRLDIAELLQRGFSVEDRSWKGAAGTSVLRTPIAMRFYQEQAESLAKEGQLELAFLRHQGSDIAFEYAWFSKGVYCTPKVGYDEAYSHLSPGQLIRYLTLERFFKEPARREFDFVGPLSEATAKWATETYSISSLIVSTGRLGSNVSLRIAERMGPKLSQLVRNCRSWVKPTPAMSPESDQNAAFDHQNVEQSKPDIQKRNLPPSQPAVATSTLQSEPF
jgi:CelD/BcsL family acetyltransferase involved in cellulose biosynthesis